MLNNLRTRVAKHFPPTVRPSREQLQQSAREARENRAASVLDLRAQVRKLQQDITDLTLGSDNGAAQSEGDTARLHALERALERAQGALAKLQARI